MTDESKIFSEHKWWYGVVILGSHAVFWGILFLFFTFSTMHREGNDPLLEAIFAAVLWATLTAASYIFISVGTNRSYGLSDTYSFALFEGNKLVRHGLKKVNLRRWPLKTKFRVIWYNLENKFSSPLQPITANPKVMPLRISITTKVEERPEAIERYTLYPEEWQVAIQEANAQIFDLLQHNFPQEEVEFLNPFDERKIARLKNFVSEKLNPKLPFGVKVTDVQLSLSK